MDEQNIKQENTSQEDTRQKDTSQWDSSTISNMEPLSNGLHGMPLEDIQPKRILSQAGFALFVMAAAVLLAQILIEVVVFNYYPGISEASWYTWVMTAIVVVGIGFPTFYYLIRKIPDSRMGEEVKLKPTHFMVLFFICTATMYITNFFSVILTTIIALLKGDNIFDLNPLMDAITGSNFILTLLYASLVAPIVEEIIFRKLLLNKLRRFGDVPAILLTAFAFGLFHLNLSQFFYATALGMIFAYIAVRTNTIKYTILLHIMINFIGTVVAPLSTSGNFVFGIVLVVWVMVAIALGSVFFVLNVKKIKLEKTVPLVKQSDYFLNTGTILYTLMCVIMIIIVTIS
jgi:membrane protease YdiL (CAAX protease family)